MGIRDEYDGMRFGLPPRPDSFVRLADTDDTDDADLDTESPVLADEMLTRNSVVIPLSREQALDFGIVEPTPEEARRRDRERLELEELMAAQAEQRAVWLARLREVAGPVGNRVLDLHHRDDIGDCAGCGERYERDPWPCPTVEAVAGTFGWPIPEGI